MAARLTCCLLLWALGHGGRGEPAGEGAGSPPARPVPPPAAPDSSAPGRDPRGGSSPPPGLGSIAQDMVAVHMLKLYEKYNREGSRPGDGNTVRSFKARPGKTGRARGAPLEPPWLLFRFKVTGLPHWPQGVSLWVNAGGPSLPTRTGCHPSFADPSHLPWLASLPFPESVSLGKAPVAVDANQRQEKRRFQRASRWAKRSFQQYLEQKANSGCSRQWSSLSLPHKFLLGTVPPAGPPKTARHLKAFALPKPETTDT